MTSLVPSHLARTLACTLSLALVPLGIHAQRRGDDGPAGRGFFQIGYMALDMDDLNAELVAAGFPEIEGSFLTLGGAGYGTRGRFLIGGAGHAVIGGHETTATGTYRLTPAGGYGMFRVGYIVYETEDFDVYPSVGIGGGGMSLEIAERSSPVFGEVLTDPQRSSSLSAGAFLLEGSVSLDYHLRMGDDDGDGGGLLFGVQAGYTYSPGDSSWRLDAINDVAGGPDMKLQGPWVRLSIGGWGGGDDD